MSQQEQPFWIIELTSNNKTYPFDLSSLFEKTYFENKLPVAYFEDNPEPMYSSELTKLRELIERLIPDTFQRATDVIANHPEKKVLYDPENQYLFLDEIVVKNYRKSSDAVSYCEIDIWVELYGFNNWDEPTYLYDTRGMVCISYKVDDLTTVVSFEIDDMV